MELSAEDQALVNEVIARFDESEKMAHRPARRRWEHFDKLYHSHQQLKTELRGKDRPDRDVILSDYGREWGAKLLIPYGFATVETILPRLLSQRPRMNFEPKDDDAERNVENVSLMIDSQQAKARYEVKLQSTVKSGLIYGLGVQKLQWRRQERDTPRLERATYDPETWVEGSYRRVLWDDPFNEDVDIWNFFWDPTASDIESCDYVIHRTFRNTRYVMRMIEQGIWRNLWGTLEDAKQAVESSAGGEKYTETWSTRRRNQGLDAMDASASRLHEVFEFHDGDRVITVLGRQWPVQVGGNPAWHGELPFQITRPTEVLHQFVGKGEIEPIEHLSHEMNTLRGQRRDNATLKLAQSYAFQNGAVDPADIKLGPGKLIPIDGDPSEVLHPLIVGDIPNSGYQEEAAIKADIERVTGISDPVTGADVGASQTATGVQLVQAAANERIKLKTRRAEVELVEPQARQWLSLDQQRIRSNRTVRVPAMPEPGEPERRWAQRQIGPAELAGEFEVTCIGGSTAPENVPQQRQDGQLLLQAFGNNPLVNTRKIVSLALEKFGVKNPEDYLAPDQSVPPQTLDLIMHALVAAGHDPRQVRDFISAALEQARQEEGQQQSQDPQQLAPGPPDESQQPPEQQAA